MPAFVFASLVSVGLMLVSVMIFYEILAHWWGFLPRLKSHRRTQILLTLLVVFLCHTLVIWLFGACYYLLAQQDFGDLQGNIQHGLLDYVYFSGESYSSLGLGDVYPTGGLRMLIAVEALLGLILIGWTVAYTYVFTERYLLQHYDPEKH